MALNLSVFDKYKNTGTTTPKSNLDLSVFSGGYKTPAVKTSYISPYLGGGAYNTVVGKPNTVSKDAVKGYAGLPESTTTQRHHVQAYELGGKSSIQNLLSLPNTTHNTITTVGNQAIEDYKSGKISLPQARLIQQTALQKEQDAKKGMYQGTAANFLGGLKEVFTNPVKSIKEAIKVNPQTTQTVKDIVENKQVKTLNYKKTVQDFTNEIKNSGINYFEKWTDVLEPSKTKSEKVGKVLSAVAGTVGLAISPITATFSASKNVPVLGAIASAVNLPLASFGDSLNNITNEGLNALVATKKIKPETADNIRGGLSEVVSLAGQIILGGRMFKGRETKIKELEKTYGKTDAQTIVKKAEEIAKKETVTQPVETLKVSPKTVEPLAQEAKKYKSAEEFGQSLLPKQGGSSLFHGTDNIEGILKEGKINPYPERDLRDVNAWKSNVSGLIEGTPEKVGKTFPLQKNVSLSQNPNQSGKFGDILFEFDKNKTPSMKDVREVRTAVVKNKKTGKDELEFRTPNSLPIKEAKTIYVYEFSKEDAIKTMESLKKAGLNQKVFSSDELVNQLEKAGAKDVRVIRQSTLEKPQSIIYTTKTGQLTDIWNKANKKTQVAEPKQYKPVTEAIVNAPETKASGVAQSIETKAIEKGLVDKGYDKLAGYDSSTVKMQSELGAKYPVSEHVKFATGEKPLPEGMKPATALSIAEDYAMETRNGELARRLANSQAATDISNAASITSLSRIRTPDSATAKIKEIQKARQEVANKKTKGKTPEKIKSEIKQSIKEKMAKAKPTKYDLISLLEKIKC